MAALRHSGSPEAESLRGSYGSPRHHHASHRGSRPPPSRDRTGASAHAGQLTPDTSLFYISEMFNFRFTRRLR